MKRFFALVLGFVILLGLVAIPAASADPSGTKYMRFTLRSMNITISRDVQFKIGSADKGEILDGWNVSYTAPVGSTELTFCKGMEGTETPLYGSKFWLASGSGNNGYLTTENRLEGILRFECYLQSDCYWNIEPQKFGGITINGVAQNLGEHGSDTFPILEQIYDTTKVVEGVELYRYIVSIPFSIPWNLPDNPVYRFHMKENDQLAEDSNLNFMPVYAEAGAKVRLSPAFNTKHHNASVTGVTVNGKAMKIEEFITMPAQDVYLDAIINDNKNASNQTVVKDLNIQVNFNEDIYYGRVLPTTEDFKKALSFSTTTKGAGLYLENADVDYLFDDTLSETMSPWVGNTWLSFTIRCKDGYIFSDSTIALEDFGKWMDDNVSITINGKRNYFLADNGDGYYNGYFIGRYYTSDLNGIEIHIFWYGGKLLNLDTSSCKPGDTVTIPKDSFKYDGYIPYRYEYAYTDASGEYQRFIVTGNTFTYPQTNGTPVEIYAMYIRGEDQTTVQSITKDASETISLNTDSAGFPSGTIVSANLIQKNEKNGEKTINHVKNALSGYATDCMVFEISASSFNQSVQPDGTVLIQFDIPSGYDGDYIDFCYVAEDGTMERIPMQVDKQNGQCAAVLEHFSLYAIAKTVNKTEHESHSTHLTTKVNAVAPTCDKDGNKAYYTCICGKWFSDSAGMQEITDRESVKVPAAHTDADGDTVCDLCGTGDVEPVPTDAASNDSPSGQRDNHTSGTNMNWIIVPVAIVCCAIVAAVIFVVKRKNKR